MAITASQLNQLYETYLGRPADIAGIQGYQASGKSLDEIAADLAWVAASNPENALTANLAACALNILSRSLFLPPYS